MLAFTDYPIVELGDVAGKMAPIRQVEVLSYDGDKYCQVSVSGVLITIKSGYLYSERGREAVDSFPKVIDLTKLPLA